ncbi:MAG: di-heme oxidoredictase family protein [Methyloligellaceae bacterium]
MYYYTPLVVFTVCLIVSYSGTAVFSQNKNTILEEGEQFPGGKATSRKSVSNSNAFSHASANMGFRKELNFKVGNGVFRKIWVSAPASTKASDGLGPLYNAKTCQRCHIKDGRGHPPKANWPDDDAVSMLMRLSIPPQNDKQKALIASGKANAIPDPIYGGQLQDLSIQGHEAEGKIRIKYTDKKVTLSDGEVVTLRKPEYQITHTGYGKLHKDIRLSPRVAPQMIGLGLLEAIEEKDIKANTDPDDKNNDGISGKMNSNWSHVHNRLMVGRFGWKAGMPTIKDQTAAAFAGDMGLSTKHHPNGAGDCTAAQDRCAKAPDGNSQKYNNAEVGDQMLDLVTFYSQNLAVPRRRNPSDAEVLKGKALFHQSGCATCHRPSYKTGNMPKQPHLSAQKIWPYTDLLLHDMGEGLADNSPEGQANGREWRTAPLWGIGLTKVVNGHTFFLHDGRARSIKEAILWHEGEAIKSRDRFIALSKKEREQLIAFVKSL